MQSDLIKRMGGKAEIIRTILTETRSQFGLKAEEFARESILMWNPRGRCTVTFDKCSDIISDRIETIHLEKFDGMASQTQIVLSSLDDEILFDRISAAQQIAIRAQTNAISLDPELITTAEGQSKLLLTWDREGRCRVFITDRVNFHFSLPIFDNVFESYSIPLSMVAIDALEYKR